jgi:hypothetical protein
MKHDSVKQILSEDELISIFNFVDIPTFILSLGVNLKNFMLREYHKKVTEGFKKNVRYFCSE